MIVHDRIRHLLRVAQVPGISRNARLGLWRVVIRLAQDEYDRELQQLDSLNVPVADPSILPGVPVG